MVQPTSESVATPDGVLGAASAGGSGGLGPRLVKHHLVSLATTFGDGGVVDQAGGEHVPPRGPEPYGQPPPTEVEPVGVSSDAEASDLEANGARPVRSPPPQPDMLADPLLVEESHRTTIWYGGGWFTCV